MSRRKCNVSYEKPQEPAFLKAFKQRIGYQEPPTIDSKRTSTGIDDDDGEQAEKEDEKPTVVLQEEDDVTVNKAKINLRQNIHNEKTDECKRIAFTKPVKRQERGELSACSKKRKTKNTKSKQSTMGKVKNSSLLSFGADEEENEDDEEKS